MADRRDTPSLSLTRAVDALRGMYGLLQLFASRSEIAQHLGDWESNHRAEEARLVMALEEQPGPRIEEDAERYRWWRQCPTEHQHEILELSGEHPEMLDHHIDKGRCGL